MNNQERYYRRSYNAINKLFNNYCNGYNPYNMNEFRKNLILEGIEKQTIMKEEQFSILFTITTALLGLNKESIEKTEKIKEYKKATKGLELPVKTINERHQERKEEFNAKRTLATPFDNWLSVIKDLTKEHDSSSIMKKIRNGILHSNFELLLDPGNIDYTYIKIKSYFEAELLNLEFEKYIFEYFSNIEGLGLAEKLYTYTIKKMDIKNKDMLHAFLEAMTINELRYKNIKSLGEKTPEINLIESIDENQYIDVEKFFSDIISSKNYENLKGQTLTLTSDAIRFIEDYIEKSFGKVFYELERSQQEGIISTHVNFMLNSKHELSNWLTHFWYFYSTLTSGQFNPVLFKGDEYGFESCLPALLILKSYLIMYRLQNKDFSEVDYKKINFELDGSIELITGNIKDPTDTENTFIRSINKEKERAPELNYLELFNKVICDVVRNSLAHGNVNIYISPLTLERKVELTDIDPKSGGIRKLRFELDSFNNFLNSDAFLPKNCYNKKAEVSSTLKKDK